MKQDIVHIKLHTEFIFIAPGHSSSKTFLRSPSYSIVCDPWVQWRETERERKGIYGHDVTMMRIAIEGEDPRQGKRANDLN